jgi:hypothetical protein
MKHTDRNALEIARQGGAIASSDWITGSGNFIKKRAIPSNCMEAVAKDLTQMPERSRRACEAILAKRPRVRAFVVIKNWNAVESPNTNPAPL